MIFRIFTLLFFLSLTYYPTLIWMYGRWSSADSYYSHGFLIPIVAFYIIYTKLKNLKAPLIQASFSGLALIISGLLIHLASRWLQVGFISGFSFLLVIFGITLFLWGKSITKYFFFPLSFIVFMIPLPLVIISNLSLKLKILAAQASVWVIQKIGFRAVVRGSTIFMPHSSLTVGDPCSGLRSLVALLALGSLFAYYIKTSPAKKVLIFLSSVPIAVLANIIRISSMCMVAEIYGEKFATGVYHDISGVFLFVIAFILLLIVGRLFSGRRT